jgi:hypothetical protein
LNFQPALATYKGPRDGFEDFEAQAYGVLWVCMLLRTGTSYFVQVLEEEEEEDLFEFNDTNEGPEYTTGAQYLVLEYTSTRVH